MTLLTLPIEASFYIVVREARRSSLRRLRLPGAPAKRVYGFRVAGAGAVTESFSSACFASVASKLSGKFVVTNSKAAFASSDRLRPASDRPFFRYASGVAFPLG